jgi:hypothetical protein
MAANRTTQIQAGGIMKIEDVDATWDGKGSLDDHRQKAFAQMQQPGFGAKAKKPEPQQLEPQVDTIEQDNDEVTP